MKKTEGYIAKELEDEYIVLPVGKRTEEVNEVISLSETAGFIYIHADQAEDIEELASDVFVALWRAPQPLRTEHLRGWLGKVARNQAISFLRRQHMQLVRDEDCILVDDRDAQKLLEAKERSALLNAALAALTSEDREIFLRRYYYNQTAGQIAEALHMNPSTVRSRLLRGRQSLRTELQKGDVQIEDLCAESV